MHGPENARQARCHVSSQCNKVAYCCTRMTFGSPLCVIELRGTNFGLPVCYLDAIQSAPSKWYTQSGRKTQENRNLRSFLCTSNRQHDHFVGMTDVSSKLPTQSTCRALHWRHTWYRSNVQVQHRAIPACLLLVPSTQYWYTTCATCPPVHAAVTHHNND